MLPVSLALLMAGPILMLRLSDTAGSFPKPLSASEERKYLELYAGGDESAKNVLIEHNLRLVAHIIKKYYTPECDQDDLISIGTIGLIKGVTTYRPERSVRLATYASRCIENEILMYFRSRRKTAGDLSLSETIDTDGDGNNLSLMDVISVPDEMLDDLSFQETTVRLMEYINSALTEQEKKIIILRYGLNGEQGKTQRETAALQGISRSYVSRIEKRALEKLRREFEREDSI